jgi:N utilization substance protein A
MFIQRSLAPSKLKEIQVDKETKKASVLVANDQVSLAIGKGGQNVRLASKLTGYEIQVLKEGGEEEEYDMDLSEFREELGDVLFHKFFDENYQTVRDVIETPKEELVSTLGIEPEKVEEIVTMLKKGLEEAEVENDEEEVAELAVQEVARETVTEEPKAEGTSVEQPQAPKEQPDEKPE